MVDIDSGSREDATSQDLSFIDRTAITLELTAKLLRARNGVYRDNWRMVGGVMQALFPDGKNLRSVDDYNRWHIFELIVVKLTRYASRYEDGGHEDSLSDMIAYLAMLKEIDHEVQARLSDPDPRPTF